MYIICYIFTSSLFDCHCKLFYKMNFDTLFVHEKDTNDKLSYCTFFNDFSPGEGDYSLIRRFTRKKNIFLDEISTAHRDI